MHRFTRSLPPGPVTQPKPWQWPRPPFPCVEAPWLSSSATSPCEIELTGGRTLQGDMVDLDPGIGVVSVHTGGQSKTIPLAHLRRLTLTTPLVPVAQAARSQAATRGMAIEEREYRLKSTDIGCPPMVGRTKGYVQAREGMYLFAPVGPDAGVRRVFVPRGAYSDHQFGPFAEDVAGMREISEPDELLQAIERQRTLAVLPLGHSLLQLGLVSQVQLDQALKKQSSTLPLGEMLVSARVISRTDLDRALAHKMGYPIVDLVHFPVQPIALQLLTLRTAIVMRAVPLMLDAERLIVAVSKAARANKLRHLPDSAKRTLVPVLAPKSRILEALTRMSGHQAWDGVPFSLRFFATTY